MTDSIKNTGTDHLSTMVLMRRLLHENIRPYIGKLLLALLFMAVMAATTALTAWLMKPVVNEVFINRDREVLWLIGGAVMATFMTKGIANYIQSTLMANVGLRIVADNQSRLFAHLARMDVSFFTDWSTGDLLTRFMVDVNSLRGAVSDVLTGVGKDSLSLIGLIAVMFIQDWQLAAISFVVFPLAVIPISRIGKRMRRVTADTNAERGQLMTLLEQTFQGIRVVKAYGMENYESGRVNNIVQRVFRLTFKAVRTRALSSPIMETLGGVAVAVVIVYGGHRVIEAQTDAGSFFSFITALLLAYEPMKRLANLNTSLQEGLAGAQRLFAVIDIEPAIQDKPDAEPLTVHDGTIRFEDVGFSYNDSAPALRGITLNVPAGKTVALVGPSGAGKTTILNLIPRFYDVTTGRITIDGTDIRDATLASLVANIALVSQDITLFDDTVRANIAYGRAGASDDDIIAAAKAAAADEFIAALPGGYDTAVGEQGVKLSGGQRQRLAIARAVLKNAPILLLDEATSSLDTESERHVQAALTRLMENRTTLVIAHRLSTVASADVIYVIENGRVAESGSHLELLQNKGTYARLYALQFNDNEVVAPAAATS